MSHVLQACIGVAALVVWGIFLCYEDRLEHFFRCRKESKRPFGAQRVAFLDKMRDLLKLRNKIGDPSHAIQRAIDECRSGLKQLDIAELSLYQAELDEVGEQRQLADLVLKVCQEDLKKFGRVALSEPPRQGEAPAASIALPLRQTGS